MSIFDDLKAKADANGDGKLTKDDLEALRDKLPADKVDELKKKADTNSDGKVDLADLKDLGGDVGSVLGGLKDKFFKK